MREGLTSRRLWVTELLACQRTAFAQDGVSLVHTGLDTHHHYLVVELFHHPDGNPVPCTTPSTQLLATTNLLPVSSDLFLLDVYINRIAQSVAFRVFFHWHVFKGHAAACIGASLLLVADAARAVSPFIR